MTSSDAAEIRCSSKRHALLLSPEVLEIKCDSRWCGAGNGVVVLHRFSTVTGELVETRKFRDPRGVVRSDSADSVAIRSA